MENHTFSNSSLMVDEEINPANNSSSIRNYLLDDNEDLEEKMTTPLRKAVATKDAQPLILGSDAQSLTFSKINDSEPFIISNTVEASLEELRHKCVIPVFSKDNEKTIAHQEFIESVMSAVHKEFPYQTISAPEIRVSHQIKGRTPDAIYLNAKDLMEHQKTVYYERMAFLIKIPSITNNINGNPLTLCVGGVRSYNQQNLYSVKSLEKFKFFKIKSV